MKPIFVAVDTHELERAQAIGQAVRGHVGGLKLGLEFFLANGPDGVRHLSALGLPIFLDLKLHDIPNTVRKAVEALAPLEPAVLTVHAHGGHEMMSAAKSAAPAATKVVAVTLLTSLDEADLSDLGIARSPADQVARLAWMARDSGLDGIVCSGEEVAAARNAWPSGYFVVPGIRPAGTDVSDQKRIATPRKAVEDGASILVIGRPITAAADPAQAAAKIAAELSKEVIE